MRIGEQLIKEGLVTDEQVDEARRSQVMHGARLGTNLVELGYLSVDDLAQALGHQHGLASGLRRHFDEANPELQHLVPVALADEFGCVPLQQVHPDLAAVAFMDPPTEQVLHELSVVMGMKVVAVIAPELRIRYQLEHVYGIPRNQRFLRGLEPPDSGEFSLEEPDASRRRYVTPLSAPDAEGALGRIALKKQEVRRARSERIVATPIDASDIVGALDFDGALRAIRTATDRDRVVELVVNCARTNLATELGCCLFLLVRSAMAFGWKGYSTQLEDDDFVGDIAIPLDEPSVLQLAYRTAVLVSGTPPPTGALIDRRLWNMIRCTPPTECVVAPVPADGQVACLLYCHGRDLGPINADTVHRVSLLAEAASAAFDRLIRASER